MSNISPLMRASLTRENNRRAANALFAVKESRSDVVRREMAEVEAAKDANTARLRALRLEKESLETLAKDGLSKL